LLHNVSADGQHFLAVVPPESAGDLAAGALEARLKFGRGTVRKIAAELRSVVQAEARTHIGLTSP
jgi:hypothetical protein